MALKVNSWNLWLNSNNIFLINRLVEYVIGNIELIMLSKSISVDYYSKFRVIVHILGIHWIDIIQLNPNSHCIPIELHHQLELDQKTVLRHRNFMRFSAHHFEILTCSALNIPMNQCNKIENNQIPMHQSNYGEFYV